MVRRSRGLRALADTCTFLWWLSQPDRLSPHARAVFDDRTAALHWSLASSWEVALKCTTGRLEIPGPPREFLPQALALEGLELMPILHEHVFELAELPRHHGDPFDRMLVAQARVEGLAIITPDPDFERYDVEVIW